MIDDNEYGNMALHAYVESRKAREALYHCSERDLLAMLLTFTYENTGWQEVMANQLKKIQDDLHSIKLNMMSNSETEEK